MTHRLDQGAGVGGRGQEIALEAVQVLDGEAYLRLLGVFRGLAQHVGGVLLLVFRGPGPREDCQRRVERPRQDVAAQDRRPIDGPFQAIDRGRADRGIGADRIGLRRQAGHRGGPQSLPIQFLAHGSIVSVVALEDRQLDAVVTRMFELLEDREVFLGDVRGPEQQVEAVTHG